MGRAGRPARPPSYYIFLSGTTVPPFLVHSSAVLVMERPLPLQPFLPLHSLPAPAQLPCPLHALMPAHFTSPPPCSAACAATTPPARMSAAAALASNIPFCFILASCDSGWPDVPRYSRPPGVSIPSASGKRCRSG